jgi:hypothetical protein
MPLLSTSLTAEVMMNGTARFSRFVVCWMGALKRPAGKEKKIDNTIQNKLRGSKSSIHVEKKELHTKVKISRVLLFGKVFDK